MGRTTRFGNFRKSFLLRLGALVRATIRSRLSGKARILAVGAWLTAWPLVAQDVWSGVFLGHSSSISPLPTTPSGSFDWTIGSPPSSASTPYYGSGKATVNLGSSTVQATRESASIWRLTTPLRFSLRVQGTFTVKNFTPSLNPTIRLSVSGRFASVNGCTAPAPQVFSGLTQGSTTAIDFTLQCDIRVLGNLSGGQLGFVESAVDFVLDIPGASLGDLVSLNSTYRFTQSDLAIDHIEVVQTVQNETNTEVPLIARKLTVVRVFPRILNSTNFLEGVTGTLRAQQNGVQLRSFSPLPAFNAPMTAVPNPRRENEFHSLDFQLPVGWTTEGALEIIAEVSGPPGIPDPVPANNQRTIKVDFVAAPKWPNPFVVGWIPVCYQPPGAAEPSCPGDAIRFLTHLTEKLYPLPWDGVIYFQLPVPPITWTKPLDTPAEREDFKAELQKLYDLYDRNLDIASRLFQAGPPERAGGMDQLIGWLPRIPGNNVAGSSNPVWLGGRGRVAMVQDYGPPDYLYTARTIAREIGHNHGLHNPLPVLPLTVLPDGSVITRPGTCGAWDPTPGWPYIDGLINQLGYDPEMKRLLGDKKYDLMGNCGPGYEVWISPYSFNRLFQAYTRFDRPLGPASAGKESPVRAAEGDPAILLISGSAQKDGPGSLLGALRISSSIPADTNAAEANHCIRLFSDSGVAGENCFLLTFSDVDGNNLAKQSFIVRMNAVDGLRRIGLFRGGTEIGSLTAGLAAPAVRIIAPQPGTRWGGGENLVQWTGNDPDGDRLAYTLQYSWNGGLSWATLLNNSTATEFRFNTRHIIGGAAVHFRVFASDGIHTSVATAGPMEIAQSPRMELAAADAQFRNVLLGSSGEQTVELRNTGDGPLTLTALTTDSELFTAVSPRLPVQVPAGATQPVVVRFRPDTEGVKTGRLVMRGGGVPELSLSLTGRGVASAVPDLEIAPAALSFGNVSVGQSAELRLTIRNFGPGRLRVSALRVTGASFAVTGSAPFEIAAAQERVEAVRFAPTAEGAASGTLTISSDDSARPSVTVALTGIGLAGNSSSPRLAAGGIVHAASFIAGLSRGALATIFGELLANGTASASSTPWPRTLGGARVRVGGIEAPLYFASPTQINFQVPFETPLGNISITVVRDGFESALQQVTISDYAPGVFTYPRTATERDPIVIHLSAQLVSPANPAAGGETLIAFVTGIGALTSLPRTGEPTPANPLPQASAPAVITLGGAPVEALFTGLTPGFIGLGQINFRLPASLPTGSVLPLRIRVGSATAPDVNLSVVNTVGSGGPTGPRISVSPASLSFGAVTTGTSTQLSITIANSGNAALSVSALNSSNPAFTVTPAAPFNIQAGGSTQVNVRFSPTSAGAQSGTLTIASNDPAQPSVQVSLSGSAGPVTTGGPQAYWKFDEGSGTVASDSTGNGNTGTLLNGAGWSPGVQGTALNLDGVNDYVNAGTTLNVGSTFTVEAWIKGDQTTMEGWGRIVDTGFATGFALGRFGGSQQVAFEFRGSAVLGSAALVIDNAWHHIVVVKSGATATMYADGVLQGSVPVNAGGPVSTLPLFIGYNPGEGIQGHWRGQIDEVHIYSRALTATEILANYNALKPSGGNAPKIGVTPTSLSFGTVTVGSPASLALTISNTGNSALSVTALTSSNAVFTVTPAAPLSIAAGASTQITVRFSPTAAGAQSGSLTIASNDPTNSALTINLTGTGGATQAPAIAVEPASLDFGNVTVGQTRDLTVTVRNTGSANLTVNSIASSNARFSATLPAPPFTVTAGASQTVTIRFSPTAAGPQSGTVTFNSNDPATPARAVSVIGSGATAQAPTIALDPATLAFGTVTVGQSRDLTVNVRNSGSANLTVNSITSSNARFSATLPAAPFTVAPGASQTATIRFSPTAAGAQSGSITFNSNDPANPARAVSVSGAGAAVAGQIPIAVGQTVNGTLTTSSARSSGCSNCYADVYRLTLAAAQTIDIRLSSGAFDTYLQILDLNGNVLGLNDDSGNSTNSRITGAFAVGTYLIEATTAFEGATGPYVLSVTNVP